MTIHINELLPHRRSISEIKTESELLLAYELSKYVKLLLQKEISLEDVIICERLRKSRHFSFVVKNGLKSKLGFKTEPPDLTSYQKSAKSYFDIEQDVLGVKFKESSDGNVWVYDYGYDATANGVMHGVNRAAAYVSLVAFVLVKSKIKGSPIKLIIGNENYDHNEKEYVELLILQNYGNKLITKELLEIQYKDSYKNPQPEWVAFVEHNRRCGSMNKEYSPKEKYTYLKEHFEIGDVVLLYSMSKTSKHKNKIFRIESCYPAVIISFNESNVYLQVCKTVTTLRTESANAAREGKNLEQSKIEFGGKAESFSYRDLGIGTCIFGDKQFIIAPVESDGTFQSFLIEGSEVSLWLNTLETIYAVFESRKITYNKERFLKKYFNGEPPIADNYI